MPFGKTSSFVLLFLSHPHYYPPNSFKCVEELTSRYCVSVEKAAIEQGKKRVNDDVLLSIVSFPWISYY